MTTIKIDGHENIIDSRDIIERIEELEGELMEAHEENAEGHNLSFEEWLKAVMQDASPAHVHERLEDVEELLELRNLEDQCTGYADWEHGEQLIAEEYFVEYIEDLINDCYELPEGMKPGQWPFRHLKLDYEAAAEEAKQDYAEVTIFGHVFLIRAV